MRILLLVPVLFFPIETALAQLPEPEPGSSSFAWEAEPGHFSVWSADAPLAAVVRDLGRLHGADIQAAIDPEETRTFRYLRVNLEECLDRLNINYTLHYTRTAAGEIVFAGGRAGGGHPPPRYQLPPLPTGPLADKVRDLIKNLKDDNIRWNYHSALGELYEFSNPEIAIPFLELALLDGDNQQKNGAYKILSSYLPPWDDRATYTDPSPAFMDIKTASLKDDDLLDVSESTPRISYSASAGLQFFTEFPEHAARAEPELTRALYQADRQYRFLSAAILGGAGRRANIARIVDILAPQLMDNDTERDSTIAAYGLSGLGPAAAPYLNAFETRADHQAKALLQTIRSNWTNPDWRNQYPYLRTSYWEQDSFARLPGDSPPE